MASEPDDNVDTFLRRAAQIAAFGAAVGAAIGAARAARQDGSGETPVEAAEAEEQDERRAEAPELGDPDEQRAQAEDEEPTPAQEPEPAEEEEEEEVLQPQDRAAEVDAEEEPEEERQEEPEPERAPTEEPRDESADGQVPSGAAGVIGRALRQLEQLTGREPDGVLGLRRDDGGWVVTVEVVELARVPSSTDVLASYDVLVDDDGDLREYRRTGRYVRGRADAGEQ